MSKKVQVIMESGEDELIFPVSVQSFPISQDGASELLDIVGVGQVIVPRQPLLKNLSLSSFFPRDENPVDKLNNLEKLFNEKKVINLTVTDLNYEAFLVIITALQYDRRAKGLQDDIDFTVELSEFRPYEAREIIIREDTNTSLPPPPPREEERKPPVPRTYTVVQGDSLYRITRTFTGNGSRWQELYNINTEVIGNNPNRIQVGMVLNIPESWV